MEFEPCLGEALSIWIIGGGHHTGGIVKIDCKDSRTPASKHDFGRVGSARTLLRSAQFPALLQAKASQCRLDPGRRQPLLCDAVPNAPLQVRERRRRQPGARLDLLRQDGQRIIQPAMPNGPFALARDPLLAIQRYVGGSRNRPLVHVIRSTAQAN